MLLHSESTKCVVCIYSVVKIIQDICKRLLINICKIINLHLQESLIRVSVLHVHVGWTEMILGWQTSLCVLIYRWFHGRITRDKAEELLRPFEEGLFLVRESHNYQGDYTLSVWYVISLITFIRGCFTCPNCLPFLESLDFHNWAFLCFVIISSHYIQRHFVLLLGGVMCSVFNKHRRLTKSIGYFAQRSQLLFTLFWSN